MKSLYNKERWLVNSVFFISLFTYSNFVLAQVIINEPPDLIPISKDKKWGYCDRNKSMIVDFKYDEAYTIFDSMAIIMINDKFGFINLDGEEIISLLYYEVQSFYDGLAYVGYKNHYPQLFYQL